MPISLSAKKSLRKSLKNRKVNVDLKNKIKKMVKDYIAKPSDKSYQEVVSMLDKAVKKNIYHINKVSRLKSRLSKMVASTKKTVTPKKTAKKVVKKGKDKK